MVIRKATPKGKSRYGFLNKNYVSTGSVTSTLGGYILNSKYEMETIKIFIQHLNYQPNRNRFLSFTSGIG